ncbi:MAG: RNA methyltransferase [Flavobacteriales bacterium]
MSENKKLKLAELGRITDAEFKLAKKIPLVLVLEDIRSMHNVGSFFRTADAFRIERIILCGVTAKPPHRDIEKTALGATKTVEWKYAHTGIEALEALQKEGYITCAIEQTQNSQMLEDFKPSTDEKYALVVGNEVKGVSQKVIDASDVTLEIPQFGTKHSLNVSICGGIVLWHFFSELKALLSS